MPNASLRNFSFSLFSPLLKPIYQRSSRCNSINSLVTMTKIFKVELGRRDHGKKIFCKAHFTGSKEFELMMLKDDGEFDWQKHVATRAPDLPGGVLQRCSPECDCFEDILYHVDLDEQVQRIAKKHGANITETRASMLLHGFCCRRDEAIERMETDSVEQLINLADSFDRKVKSYDIFKEIKTNILINLGSYQ